MICQFIYVKNFYTIRWRLNEDQKQKCPLNVNHDAAGTMKRLGGEVWKYNKPYRHTNGGGAYFWARDQGEV